MFGICQTYFVAASPGFLTGSKPVSCAATTTRVGSWAAMSYCLILQHDDAFGPGQITPSFRDFGIPTRVHRVDHDGVPQDIDEVRLLVILGGPQRLTTGDAYGEKAGWLDGEVELVQRFVDEDRPTLGVGLGSQILAKAAGAEVTPLSKGDAEDAEADPHLGWGQLRLPFPGGTDPLLFGLSDGTPMFFWQKDSFSLPKLPPPEGYDPDKPGPPPPSGNLLMSSVPWDRNAAFRFKNRLYGLAYHPEFTRDGIEALLKKHGGAVGAAFGSGAVDKLRSETEKHFPRYERLGRRLLDNLVQYFKAYDPPM